jgi:YD repeat-containing protein
MNFSSEYVCRHAILFAIALSTISESSLAGSYCTIAYPRTTTYNGTPYARCGFSSPMEAARWGFNNTGYPEFATPPTFAGSMPYGGGLYWAYFHDGGYGNGPWPYYRIDWQGSAVEKNHGGQCGAHGGAGTSNAGSAGNPISLATKSKTALETDYATSNLKFSRQFNSAQAFGVSGTLGSQWSMAYTRLVSVPTYGTSSYPNVRRESGRILGFFPSANGWTSEADITDRLVEVKDTSGVRIGWRYAAISESTIETYNADGKLLEAWDISGRKTSLAYDVAVVDGGDGSPATLDSIADFAGRKLSLAYDAGGRVASVIDPDGRTIQYVYGDFDNLLSVIYQDGASRSYVYNEAAYTSRIDNPRALTGLIDEKGVRFATYRYDASANAVATEHANGVALHSLIYNADGSTTVTDPSGASRVHTFQTTLGVVKAVGRSQPAGSGCAASTSALSYDVNGNVASEDDFNGNRVCKSHDLTRNLESVRVQGLATAQTCSAVTAANAALPTGSRKVSTQWHPDWRLATRTAEPGRITTSVYNGQPDPFAGNAIASCAPSTALLPDGKPIVVLCKSVEQATTDANGALGFSAALQSGVVNRVSQWSYNQFGQVLSHDGPRTDVSDLTTYTYHPATTVDVTQGDLATMSNAAGKVASYTKYNKHGQLLQSTDPNGVVTVNSYDLRQRLLSTSVGGQTTGYTYDAAGQLTRMTRPDASWIGYEYDDAHRQKAVLDNKGNRIDYTLDNAGNKTGQAVKDPGGALRRTLARSIDALGRAQQTTGRE